MLQIKYTGCYLVLQKLQFFLHVLHSLFCTLSICCFIRPENYLALLIFTQHTGLKGCSYIEVGVKFVGILASSFFFLRRGEGWGSGLVDNAFQKECVWVM